MFSDILTNKWFMRTCLLIIIACIVFIVFVEIDSTRFKRGIMKLQNQRETPQQVDTFPDTESMSEISPMESTTPHEDNPIVESSDVLETDIISDAGQEQQTVMHEETADALEVSPFGFGPYPEVPEGMLNSIKQPYKPIWKDTNWPNIGLPEMAELLSRVAIKAWKEGLHRDWIGIGSSNGIIYFNYPKTVYVWYGEKENDDGSITRYFIRAKGMSLSLEQMRKGIVPPGVRVLDGEKEGIDPYEYLDLPKQ